VEGLRALAFSGAGRSTTLITQGLARSRRPAWSRRVWPARPGAVVSAVALTAAPTSAMAKCLA
jgi:hypothetical protein